MLSRVLPIVCGRSWPRWAARHPADAYIGPGRRVRLSLVLPGAGRSRSPWPSCPSSCGRSGCSSTGCAAARPGGTGSAERVVIVGLDGLDPGLAERFMAEGKLPNFSRLAGAGDVRPPGHQLPLHLARGLVLVHDGRGLLAPQHLRLPHPGSPQLHARPLLGGDLGGPDHLRGQVQDPGGQAPGEAPAPEPPVLEAPRRARRVQLHHPRADHLSAGEVPRRTA